MRYQYTIQRPADSENEIEQAEFLWRFGSWTTCTATCGTGELLWDPRAWPPAVEERRRQSIAAEIPGALVSRGLRGEKKQHLLRSPLHSAPRQTPGFIGALLLARCPVTAPGVPLCQGDGDKRALEKSRGC